VSLRGAEKREGGEKNRVAHDPDVVDGGTSENLDFRSNIGNLVRGAFVSSCGLWLVVRRRGGLRLVCPCSRRWFRPSALLSQVEPWRRRWPAGTLCGSTVRSAFC
jgi:hypothetical protein